MEIYRILICVLKKKAHFFILSIFKFGFSNFVYEPSHSWRRIYNFLSFIHRLTSIIVISKVHVTNLSFLQNIFLYIQNLTRMSFYVLFIENCSDSVIVIIWNGTLSVFCIDWVTHNVDCLVCKINCSGLCNEGFVFIGPDPTSGKNTCW